MTTSFLDSGGDFSERRFRLLALPDVFDLDNIMVLLPLFYVLE